MQAAVGVRQQAYMEAMEQQHGDAGGASGVFGDCVPLPSPLQMLVGMQACSTPHRVSCASASPPAWPMCPPRPYLVLVRMQSPMQVS